MTAAHKASPQPEIGIGLRRSQSANRVLFQGMPKTLPPKVAELLASEIKAKDDSMREKLVEAAK